LELYKPQYEKFITRVLSGATPVFAVSMSPIARAQLSESSWIIPEDNQILNDGSTGIQWLGHDETARMSYNQVLAQLGSGGEFAGFSLATESQVDTLFADAGIPT
jgi:hypothetical protein